MAKYKSPSWQRKEGKSPSGGLNAKGRASLKAAGHDIKAPQPEGGPRKKSFCARSAGQMKKFPNAAKDPNSRLRLARKKWKC
jgi:ribosomal protein S12